MSDPNDTTPESFADLPIQPTGSGVADLEVAYEQMRLVEDAEQTTGAPIGEGMIDVTVPTEETTDTADSAAHPS